MILGLGLEFWLVVDFFGFMVQGKPMFKIYGFAFNFFLNDPCGGSGTEQQPQALSIIIIKKIYGREHKP